MSFIRCLSNPESLYVFSDGVTVYFLHHVKKPHSSGIIRIPDGVFRGCAKKWVKSFGDGASFRGMKVEDVVVDRNTGKVISPVRPCKKFCKRISRGGFVQCLRCIRRDRKIAERERPWFAVQVSYKGAWVRLWSVTWEYMMRRFEREEG